MTIRYTIIVLASLTGCATAPSIVKVPVSMPCVTPNPDKPTLVYRPGTYSSTFEIVRDLKGDREQMTAYEIHLEAALASCK